MKIYSYETQYEVLIEEDENSIHKPESVLEILDHRIKKNTIKDEITLTEKQKDELFGILTAPMPDRAGVAFCYDPHHLIVFYDVSDKAFAYIELCLECGIKETSKPFYVNFSLENAEQIGLVFRRFGVSYLGAEE